VARWTPLGRAWRGLRRLLRDRLELARRALLPREYGALQKRVGALERNARSALASRHPELAAEGGQRAALLRAEYQIYSQDGEDGILAFLFAKIGTGDRRFVEFGIGDVTRCNSTHLALGFGWSGLLVDGERRFVERARRFYEEHPEAAGRVRIAEAWITPENVDAVFRANGVPRDVDLVSIDIDGNDYWVWRALEAVRPRVVAIEYNASLGPEELLVTRYEEHFDRFALHPRGWYHGASLAALERLGRTRGYRLVGCDSAGFNAFFVRDDAAEGKLAALPAKEAFYPCRRRLREATAEEQWESLRHLPFERP
jgi:hypothetical protein